MFLFNEKLFKRLFFGVEYTSPCKIQTMLEFVTKLTSPECAAKIFFCKLIVCLFLIGNSAIKSPFFTKLLFLIKRELSAGSLNFVKLTTTL